MAAPLPRAFLPALALILAGIAPLPAAPAADLQLVTCETERPGAAPGPLKLRVVVRNDGTGPSRDATLRLRFLDDAGAFVASAVVSLDDGAVAPGARSTFAVTISDCPAYRRLVTALVWTTGTVPLAGNDLTREPRVEVGECLFRRRSNGDLLVTGRVRNGRAAPVGEVAITFAFNDRAGRKAKAATRKLDGAIPAGAVAMFRWRLPECPPIFSFSVSIDARELEGPVGDFDPDRNARAEGLSATAVRVKTEAPPPVVAAEAPPDPGPADPPPPGPAAPYAIVVDGLEWIPGTFRAKKPTGDTAFLRLKFADAKGKPARPEATVIVRVVDRDRNRGFCRRKVTKTAWKLDASKITGGNANPNLVAFHPEEGALWVGLVSAVNSYEVELALDVSVEIPKAGTWSWKGLRDPFRTALAPPEPEKQ
jgi:hypothetical protein